MNSPPNAAPPVRARLAPFCCASCESLDSEPRPVGGGVPSLLLSFVASKRRAAIESMEVVLDALSLPLDESGMTAQGACVVRRGG